MKNTLKIIKQGNNIGSSSMLSQKKDTFNTQKEIVEKISSRLVEKIQIVLKK